MEKQVTIGTRSHPALISDVASRQVALRGENVELRRAHRRLAAISQRYRELFELSPVGYLILDGDAVVREANRAACRLLGQRASTLAGTSVQVLAVHEDRPRVHHALSTLSRAATARCEICLLGPGGRALAVELTFSASGDDEQRVHVAMVDLSAHRQAEHELRESRDSMRRLAYHDPLTELPNRLLLNDRLDQALLRARRRMAKVALLFLDLDRFKQVNDTLGHAAGDRLLCEFAARLRGSVRREDTVARVAGDEFTVVLENIENLAGAREVAEKILHALREPMVLEGRSLRLSASIGFALYPDHGRSAAELLECADHAMLSAKQAGRDRAAGLAR